MNTRIVVKGYTREFHLISRYKVAYETQKTLLGRISMANIIQKTPVR